MGAQSRAVPDRSRNDVFTALAHRRRRNILSVLQRLDRAEIEELAAHLVATETDRSLLDVSHGEAANVRRTLEHVHLPRLAEADLVHHSGDVVQLTEHPALQDPKIETIVDTDTEDWDAVLACLADRRRRIVLSTLSTNETPIDRLELATQLAETLRGDSDPNGSVKPVLQELHHTHLPKLESAGLLNYDVDTKTITYDGHPALDEEWLVADESDSPRSILATGNEAADIWTLEGRDNVAERGRALVASAEEELFMMFTGEGTVEAACIRRIQDAIDRGVDVYLGTQNQELRDMVRTHVPEATIWEPQMDWLNLPPTGETVGRVILADREEVLLGTVGTEGPDGVPSEMAITGAGEDNPLVTLLRELLGSRMDHLDAQSEDARSELTL